jgi:20S proteasome subunit beta 7
MFETLHWPFVFSLSDHMWDDGNSLGPKEIHSYLTRVMYTRRNKFDPLWNHLYLVELKRVQRVMRSTLAWYALL